ncbi:hypothetical protein M0R45_029639 [Rubus argutus]|uniref:Uncharacterized protein n=1 Tax=Rubus argutus TaxID=59490 RepID=A0AAW1W929_RUBAR
MLIYYNWTMLYHVSAVALVENLLSPLENVDHDGLRLPGETGCPKLILKPMKTQLYTLMVSEYGTKRPGKFAGMLDIVHFDSHMLRIFSFLNPRVGSSSHCLSLTVSFTPGLLSSVWGALETYLFPGDGSNEWS